MGEPSRFKRSQVDIRKLPNGGLCPKPLCIHEPGARESLTLGSILSIGTDGPLDNFLLVFGLPDNHKT